VSGHVLLHVTFLGKTVVALVNRADEGLFLCVDPQVVKKIVPFFKDFMATLEVTKKGLCPSFGSILLRLDEEKLSCLW
jgi:hypothetical protein